MASHGTASENDSQSVFEERMSHIITTGSIIPCIAVGSKLGLFDKMAEFNKPKTSQQIAEVTDCKERYVREWLNSMVSIQVFDYDEERQTYFFPEHKQHMFTTKEGKNSLVNSTEALVLITGQYDELQKCFGKDGPSGVHDDNYVGLFEWREGYTSKQFTADFIKSVFKQEPGLLDKLERGIRVCDMGCSTGAVSRVLAILFPNSHIDGCDIGADAIQRANQINEKQKLANLSFSVQDVCELPADWSEKFDLVVTYDVIHDLAYASKGLVNIRRSLKSGGQFYMLDYSSDIHPAKNDPSIYTYSLYHCLAQSMWYENSEGLGLSWGNKKAKEMLVAAGFSAVREMKKEDEVYMHMICDK